MAVVKDHYPREGHHQILHRFDNGYGASVVQGPYTYGGPEGLWEIAVIKWDGDEFYLTYSTTITNDVLGHVDESGIPEILSQIESLSVNEKENN